MSKTIIRLMMAAVLFGSTACMALFAQDTQTAPAAGQKELTIEELFLKSVELQIMREKAFSEDYDVKMNVLDDIDKMITNATVGDNSTQIETMLEYLSLEGTLRTVRQDRRQVNNFPEVRRRAANMLGRLGGVDSMKALVTVLLGDEEPMVKSEAVYGLGVIGLNEKNEAIAAITFAFNLEDPAKPDNNFAYAIVLAIEKLAQKTGGIKDPAAYRTLIKIAQGSYLSTVRAKALQVIDELKKST
jgi:HEAT repeat protein